MNKLRDSLLKIRGWRRKHRPARFDGIAHQLLAGIVLAVACQSALAQAMYRIKPIGNLGGCTAWIPTISALNNAGQVTGSACNAHGDTHAFLWRNDGTPLVDLGPAEAGSYSEGVALNSSGVVTGDAQDSTGEFGFLASGNGTPMKKIYDGLGGNSVYPMAMNDLGQLTGYASVAVGGEPHAFIWKNDGSPMLDLGTGGNDWSEGEAINASGQVAVTAGAGGERFHEGYIWKNDGTPLSYLGADIAIFINKSGQIAGLFSDTSRGQAYLWRNNGTPPFVLGTLGGAESVPNALNDSGQIAGWSNTRQDIRRHAFIWMNNGTPIKDLGTLGGIQSAARDMNSAGQVTGWAYLAGNSVEHAFLWRNDGTKMQDLNSLLDPTDPLKPYVTLTSGELINKLGDIVANGTDSRTGVPAQYLLQGTVLTLAPRSLAFGNQAIHTASVAKSVTLTNTGAKAAVISNIKLTGPDAAQFASTDTCGSSLAGHATCAIKVTFKPTTKGAKTGSLSVNGGGGGLRVVALTGAGT